jgi:hypothetical protein
MILKGSYEGRKTRQRFSSDSMRGIAAFALISSPADSVLPFHAACINSEKNSQEVKRDILV